jgi:hypothetical protein
MPIDKFLLMLGIFAIARDVDQGRMCLTAGRIQHAILSRKIHDDVT